MGATNTTRWIGIGLLGLPLYGVLTFFSSLNPQPDPNTQFEAWSHYVSTDFYALKHLFASILGLILGIFGTFALGAYLITSWTRIVAAMLIIGQVDEFFFPSSFLPDFPDPLNTALVFGFLASMVYAQAYRYRRVSGPVERQQTKWIVFGIAAMVLGTQSSDIVLQVFPQTWLIMAGHTVYYLSLLLIPLSIGVAILRHHLFDIDLIIKRTLVYGALTASVVGLYILVVGGLGVMLQVRGNLLVSILAAGLVAVLFQPLRERLQQGVNRLLYGERDDPYAVLSRLGSRLESRLAPDAVLPAVTRTVRETLRLPYAEIQLRREDGFETAAVAGSPVENALRLPLVYGGETVGQLVLGPRAGDDRFSEVRIQNPARTARQSCEAGRTGLLAI